LSNGIYTKAKRGVEGKREKRGKCPAGRKGLSGQRLLEQKHTQGRRHYLRKKCAAFSYVNEEREGRE